MKKERADKVLVERGLAETLPKAQAFIMAGLVSLGGKRVEKPGLPIDPQAALEVEKPLPYVGRGGLKLEQALDAFAVDVRGRVCADIGSSTGGFTDCLLQRGAARVFAVDVDIRQLDARLRRDPRVIPLEKNARNLVPADFPERPSLAVMDVSFISILKILPALRLILGSKDKPGRRKWFTEQRSESLPPPIPGLSEVAVLPAAAPLLLTLIKPQFEAEKGRVGKKGIVHDPALHAEVLARVAEEAAGSGLALRGLVRCSTRGQKGNQEFFAQWVPGGVEPPAEAVIQWIRTVTIHETD
jgi:23S rRNA (cytidine1920-2'-O)/16S rRNA (cytidine1409-2'-O)-methyltransferase